MNRYRQRQKPLHVWFGQYWMSPKRSRLGILSHPLIKSSAQPCQIKIINPTDLVRGKLKCQERDLPVQSRVPKLVSLFTLVQAKRSRLAGSSVPGEYPGTWFHHVRSCAPTVPLRRQGARTGRSGNAPLPSLTAPDCGGKHPPHYTTCPLICLLE